LALDVSQQPWCILALFGLQAEALVSNLEKEHKQEAGKLVSVSAAPEKARRQADLAVADLATAQQLLAAAETKRMEVESAVRGASEQLRQRQVRNGALRHHCLV
jgi:hypothetical protein